MEYGGVDRIENPNQPSSTFEVQQTSPGFAYSGYTLDDMNINTKSYSLSWKLSTPVLHHDPSYSGDVDPYTILILSQL